MANLMHRLDLLTASDACSQIEIGIPKQARRRLAVAQYCSQVWKKLDKAHLRLKQEFSERK
jgi:hypothetical protein